MNKNKRSQGRNKAIETYLLSRILFCGECNGQLVGNRKFSDRNKDKYVSYECSKQENVIKPAVPKQ